MVIGSIGTTDECVSDGRPMEYMQRLHELIREMGTDQFEEIGSYIDAANVFVDSMLESHGVDTSEETKG